MSNVYGNVSLHYDTESQSQKASMGKFEHTNVLPSGEGKGKRKEGKRTQRLKTHLDFVEQV